MQNVSIGRIVHITGHSTRRYAAIVTDVYADDRIEALIFTRRGASPADFGHRQASFVQVSPVMVAASFVQQGDEPGEWSWPKRAA